MRAYINSRLFAFVRAACIVVLTVATVSNAAFGQSASPDVGSVWFWFGACKGGKTMGVELSVDGKTVYQSTFRACRMQRSDARNGSRGKTEIFRFPGGHTFQNTYGTTKREQVECNIWQAGADPDDMLLGVSFVAHNQVLLNTVHIVRPGRRTQSKLDPDVVIKTYPIALVDAPH